VSTPLGRDWLLANLPHQGAMNLLAEIVEWDESRLRARAEGHRSPTHALRRGTMLPATAAIEYGAQAAAAHGALAAQAPSGAVMIAAVRAVRFHATRLDDVEEDLEIRAEQLGGGAAGVIYGFEVAAGDRVLAEGRVTIAFSK